MTPPQPTTVLPQSGGSATGAGEGNLSYARKQVAILIEQADQLGARVVDNQLKVSFNVSGDGADQVTLLCRSGRVPDVWRSSFRVCNSGRAHILSDMKPGKLYGIGVMAQFAGSGRVTDEVSTTFIASEGGVSSSPNAVRSFVSVQIYTNRH